MSKAATAPAVSPEQAAATARTLKTKRLRDAVKARHSDMTAAELKLTEERAKYAKAVAEYAAHEYGFALNVIIQKKAFGSVPKLKGRIKEYDEKGRPVLAVIDNKTNRETRHLTATVEKADEWFIPPTQEEQDNAGN